MAKRFLDENGLLYFWKKIETQLNSKAPLSHSHKASEVSSLATVATSGKYSDLSGKPTSLPANGGNADTVDGYHIVVSNSEPTVNDTSVVTIVI